MVGLFIGVALTARAERPGKPQECEYKVVQFTWITEEESSKQLNQLGAAGRQYAGSVHHHHHIPADSILLYVAFTRPKG